MSNVSRLEIEKLEKENEAELVGLVSELIRIPSENPTGTQREVINFVKNYLTDAGIPCEEVGSNPAFPCVVAGLGTKDGFSIILNGHVDVVPAGDRSQWNYDPFCGTVTDGRILGRGTSDMKAGVAGILFAMKILKQSGAALNGNIRLHIVSDEESSGEYGTKWLCANGYAENADACLVAEPTSSNDIEIGQRGRLNLTFHAQGQSAHGSLAGYKGDNAILKLTRVLDGIPQLTAITGHYQPGQQHALKNSKRAAEEKIGVSGSGEVISHVSANVGIIHGGTRPNMVPDSCEAIVDVRTPIGVDRGEIEHTVQKIVDDSGVSGITYTLDWQSDANCTDENAEIVRTIKKNAEDIWKIEVIPSYQWASSDAREYRCKGIPTIQYGPANTEGIHSYNENVDVQDVLNAGLIYVRSLCNMMGIK